LIVNKIVQIIYNGSNEDDKNKIVLESEPIYSGLYVESENYKIYHNMTRRGVSLVRQLAKKYPGELETLIDNASSVLPRKRSSSSMLWDNT